jgi:UDP-glucose 4-epimerase
MGMSKALMEKTMVAESRTCNEGQVFCGTRYGNVIASRGSVIPLFINQIRTKKEITITNPNMTRFLMSLDDATDLVLFAFNHGQNGDIFVQKAPRATVLTIAKAVIQLLGKSEESVKIRVIGSRHGEKMHESLMGQEEMAIAEDLGLFYKVPCDNRGLNYQQYFTEGLNSKSEVSSYSSDLAPLLDTQGVVDLLSKNREVFEELQQGFGK